MFMRVEVGGMVLLGLWGLGAHLDSMREWKRAQEQFTNLFQQIRKSPRLSQNTILLDLLSRLDHPRNLCAENVRKVAGALQSLSVNDEWGPSLKAVRRALERAQRSGRIRAGSIIFALVGSSYLIADIGFREALVFKNVRPGWFPIFRQVGTIDAERGDFVPAAGKDDATDAGEPGTIESDLPADRGDGVPRNLPHLH